MAFTAVAAMATYGGATALGVSVFTAMSYVGIAMAVVGAVTKDKQLLQTGGMMSLMGGVGGAIEGATASGAADAAATDAAKSTAQDAAQSAAGDAASNAAGSAAQGSAGATIQNPSTDIIKAATPDSGALANPATGQLATATPASGSMTTTPAAVTPSVSTPAVTDVAGAQAPVGAVAPSAPSGPVTPADTTYGMSSMGQNDPQVAQMLGTQKTNSNTFFSQIGDVWNGLGPQGKAAAIQFAGGALSGANQTAMWNEKMALEQRALDQRSYGSSTPIYRKTGIISSAKV